MPETDDLGCCGKPAGEVCIHDLHPALPLPPSPTEEWRAAVCEWMTANGIDYNNVPLHTDLAIEDRQIHYTEFVRDTETGNILYDASTDGPKEQAVAAPCLVEPPAWLNIPGAQP